MDFYKNGKLISEELTPNGSTIKVNKDNLEEYVTKMVENIQFKDKNFVNEIKYGLFSIIPEHFIYVFNSTELELILNGQHIIDIDDWKKNTIYNSPYHVEHQVISWFWKILFEVDFHELPNFLLFCTGSSRIPVTGFR